MNNNTGKKWSSEDVNKLKKFVKQDMDTDDIAKALGRTKPAIYSKASDENISLMPKDK